MNTHHPLPIFKVGRHTDMSGTTLVITEADLQQTVAAYQPGRHEAPLVVGHPQHDAPAWGWVASLALLDGVLLATPHQVEPAFAEQVSRGRYKKISASFYTPNAPSNPHPGVYYLRHVGFLGAQPPAVKGLPDPMFREAEPGVVTWETTPEEAETTSDDPSLLHTQNRMENEMPALPETVDLSAFEAELQRKTEELSVREAQFAEREARLHSAETAFKRQQDLSSSLHFVEQLVQQGRILPRHRSGLAAFIASLDESGLLEFAEPGEEEGGEPVQIKSSAREFIQRFLQELPNVVAYQEWSAVGGTGTHPLSFSAAEGYMVDAAGLELHSKVTAYADQHKVDFASALQAIGHTTRT
ncbi:MAG: hypothetical protein H7837_11215 [Magnetococcus sp. MYC-9]